MWHVIALCQLYSDCAIGLSSALENYAESMTNAMLQETLPSGKQMHPCLEAWFVEGNVIYPLPWRRGFFAGAQ